MTPQEIMAVIVTILAAASTIGLIIKKKGQKHSH